MQKDVDAFRTISEVGEELGLPQHVLRFWEMRFPSIRPMKRTGGRRYYRPEDVDLLRSIKRLLYDEGYTIKGVQRILKEHGARAVAGRGAEWRGPGATGDAQDLEGTAPIPPIPPNPSLRQGREEEEEEGEPRERLSPRQAKILRAALNEIERCVQLLRSAASRDF